MALAGRLRGRGAVVGWGVQKLKSLRPKQKVSAAFAKSERLCLSDDFDLARGGLGVVDAA